MDKNEENETVDLSSFEFYKELGRGAFGVVYLVKKISN